MLITTDDMLRRCDLHNCPLFLNYDLPADPTDYLYRLGRTTCFGCKVVAVSFATSQEIDMIRKLEDLFYTTIQEMPESIKDYL